MKVYTFYTASHEIFLNEFFKASYQDECPLEIEEFEQFSNTGAFEEKGWRKTMLKKVDYILHSADQEQDYFIHADCDIQFFEPVVDRMIAELEEKNLDILGQDDGGNTMCAGFFIAKANKEILDLFKKVRRLTKWRLEKNDQLALNALLHKTSNKVKWGLLDHSYFSVWMGNGHQVWEPGQEFKLPEKIKMHHGNYTLGTENKKAILETVRDLRNKRV